MRWHFPGTSVIVPVLGTTHLNPWQQTFGSRKSPPQICPSELQTFLQMPTPSKICPSRSQDNCWPKQQELAVSPPHSCPSFWQSIHSPEIDLQKKV